MLNVYVYSLVDAAYVVYYTCSCEYHIFRAAHSENNSRHSYPVAVLLHSKSGMQWPDT